MSNQPIDTTANTTSTVKKANHALHDRTEEIASAAAEKTHDGIQKIGETIEKLMANTEGTSKEITQYVEKNPLKSLAIAGLTGMLLGLLIK